MTFVYEFKDKLYINKNIYDFYDTERNLKSLLKNNYKKKTKFYDFSSSSSSSEENLLYAGGSSESNDIEYRRKRVIIDDLSSDDEYYAGYPGELEDDETSHLIDAKKKSKKTSKSKPFMKIKYLKVMPTFINVVKGKILYKNKSKYTIEPIKPSDYKNVILGIVIDLSKISEDVKTVNMEKIHKFITKYSVVPLMYNDSRNIIYRNKKTHFFSKRSKLAFLTFKMPANYKYYCENVDMTPLSKLHDIDESMISSNSLIAHFIYENYYFLHNKPKELKIENCYIINLKSDGFDFVDFNKVKEIIPNDRKISLDEIHAILTKAKNMLKF